MEYYLCILDFEATCWINSENKEQMEIIEFPSVLYKINETTKTIEFVSEFSEYVRPTINPILTPFCTELTGITQETVDKADIINNVYKRHRVWISQNVSPGSNFIIGTCGHWDLATQLPREIKNKNLKKEKYYATYINVKDEFKNFYKTKCGGMTDMLKKLNIELEGRHHSGIDDSRNTAKIMLKMIADGHKYSDFVINKVGENKK